MSEIINNFSGEYTWLSNFKYCEVFLDDIPYCTAEHAYQASKTLIHEERDRFYGLTAGQAKRMGKRVTLRSDWDDIKLDVMRDLCVQKFNQSPFRNKLLRTKDAVLQACFA